MSISLDQFAVGKSQLSWPYDTSAVTWINGRFLQWYGEQRGEQWKRSYSRLKKLIALLS